MRFLAKYLMLQDTSCWFSVPAPIQLFGEELDHYWMPHSEVLFPNIVAGPHQSARLSMADEEV